MKLMALYWEYNEHSHLGPGFKCRNNYTVNWFDYSLKQPSRIRKKTTALKFYELPIPIRGRVKGLGLEIVLRQRLTQITNSHSVVRIFGWVLSVTTSGARVSATPISL